MGVDGDRLDAARLEGESNHAVKYIDARLAFFFGVLPCLLAARIDALIGK